MSAHGIFSLLFVDPHSKKSHDSPSHARQTLELCAVAFFVVAFSGHVKNAFRQWVSNRTEFATGSADRGARHADAARRAVGVAQQHDMTSARVPGPIVVQVIPPHARADVHCLAGNSFGVIASEPSRARHHLQAVHVGEVVAQIARVHSATFFLFRSCHTNHGSFFFSQNTNKKKIQS